MSLDDFSEGPDVSGKRVCGVDEAGRGPVMGPLVVAGCMVDDDRVLRDLGVKDSKKVAPKKREVLAEKIREVASYEITVMAAEDIDVLRERYTLNVIEAKLFATIIEKLDAEVAYVDAADTNEDEFRNHILKEIPGRQIISKHGADEIYPRVSAASILAKTKRDALIAEIGEEFGVPIGSGYPSDQTTTQFLKDWYSEHGDMPPHTRMSWKTVKRLINEVNMTSLGKFEEKDEESD